MRRLQLLAGVTFVSAWIIGLVLANGGSEPSDSSQTIAGYYDNHELKSIIATILIDGVAGLAIFLLGYCLWVYSAGVARGLRATVLWAGIVAGFASLVQMVVGITMSHRAAHGADPDSVNTLFNVLNNGDTVKIAFLALMIATASWSAWQTGRFPRWLSIAGLIFAPLLLISGLAFALDSEPLYASLAATLVALLLWVISHCRCHRRTTPERTARPAMT